MQHTSRDCIEYNLSLMFQQEANESMVHAATIRNAIVKHGGECVTERDPMTISHTTDTREMLQGALAITPPSRGNF